MSSSSSPSEIVVSGNVCNNAHILQQWKNSAALAFSSLGLIDALFTAKRGHLATIIETLLTGAQATALVSVFCAAYLVWKYKDRDVDPPKLVADIPAVACYVSGTLLVVVTCMCRWKATCTAVGLVVVFLFAANAAKVKAFGVRAVQCCSDIKSALCAALALLIAATRGIRAAIGTVVADVDARVEDP